MADNIDGKPKGRFEAVVESNSRVRGHFWRLELDFAGEGANAFIKAQPGQFAEFDLTGAGLPPAEQIPENLRDAAQKEVLLRRPFSFARVAREKDKVEVDVLYCVLGPATLRMTTLRHGDKVSVLGPMGHGFWMPAGKKQAILVAGGMGAPPLQHLAQWLTATHPTIEPVVFAGAKTKDELPYAKPLDKIAQGLEFSLSEFADYGVRSIIATDDGTIGFAGTVTACLANWLSANQPPPDQTIIYACGPEAMLAATAKLAAERRVDCQVSMEREMACGIGVCQSCAVECRTNQPGEKVYKLCCKDGPVFDAKEVIF